MNLYLTKINSNIIWVLIGIIIIGMISPNVFADDDIRVEGKIQLLGVDHLQVTGILFYVDNNTEIKGQHGALLQFTDLKLGDSVEVRADMTLQGYYLATRIELGDRGEELEVEGKIQEIYPDSLKVGGIFIQVDQSVEVRGEHGQPLQYSDLMVGYFVEVRAELRGSGKYFAYRIDLEHESTELEFRGNIETIGANSITVNTVILEVGGDTQIRGSMGQTLTLNDLMIGDKVEVKAILLPSGTYLALRIRLENEFEHEIEFKAPIDSIYSDTLLIAGLEFWVDLQTIILGDNQKPLALSDLQVGFIVEIKGSLLQDGTIYASLITVEDFWQAEIEIKGEITSLGNDWLTVNELRFTINSQTIVLNDNNTLIPFSDLQPGQIVEVKARKQQANTLLAIRIKLEREDGKELEMKGFIENIAAGNVQVSGIVFLTDQNTAVLNHANQSISLNDLKPDMFVEVKAFLQGSGSYLATRIKIEDDFNFVKISGKVSDIQSNTISVGSSPVNLNSQTIFINQQYVPISLSNITVGQAVTLWADFKTASSPQMLQLKIDGIGNVTGINDVSINKLTPASFQLDQNYPNPFNPSTTISFTLQNSGLVTLMVYNILGEQLEVLVNGVTAAGTHSVSFDATNYPSGYYFYTLAVEGQRETRKMLLVR
ncbi:MAG: T9SS type A sorting domain-containing protein [bacterium]|nr:MAG: T9SS type A sorting domain-containing protein [bacterium]